MSNRTRAQRKKVDYEANVPRCATCTQFEPMRVVMVKEQPFYRQAHCKLNDFQCSPNAVCCLWRDKQGSTLLQQGNDADGGKQGG